MRSTVLLLCVGLMLTQSQVVNAFENLDFESAAPVITGDPNADSVQLVTDVLPHWAVVDHIEPGLPFDTVHYNLINPHLGLWPPVFNVFDSGDTSGLTPIEGTFSLAMSSLLAGADLYQTGIVPTSSRSIRFSGILTPDPLNDDAYPPGPLDVYLGGTKLNLLELGLAGSVTEYGANVPASMVDTSAELRFSLGDNNLLVLDDIYFSPIPVPEPASLLLMTLGAAAIAASRRRR